MTLPKSQLGICCVTPAATAALALRRISPSVIFDAHLSELSIMAVAAGGKLKRFAEECGNQPITNNFIASGSLLDVHPDVEVCVETWPERNTTILKLNSETI